VRWVTVRVRAGPMDTSTQVRDPWLGLVLGMTYIKYSLDFLRPIATAEAYEAVDRLADHPQQTWPQAGRSSRQPQTWRRRPCLLGIVRRL